MTKRLATFLSTLMCNVALLGAAEAAPPADAPAGAMGVCKDGSYSTSAAKRGACRGHKGVQEWYGSDTPAVTPGGPKATSTSTAAPVTAPPTITSTAPAAAPSPQRTTTSTTNSARSTSTAQPAAGSGPGLVWVNVGTKVYHCSGDRWYGKSKQGSYMSEADAKGQGNRPSHGKACAAT